MCSGDSSRPFNYQSDEFPSHCFPIKIVARAPIFHRQFDNMYQEIAPFGIQVCKRFRNHTMMCQLRQPCQRCCPGLVLLTLYPLNMCMDTHRASYPPVPPMFWFIIQGTSSANYFSTRTCIVVYLYIRFTITSM